MIFLSADDVECPDKHPWWDVLSSVRPSIPAHGKLGLPHELTNMPVDNNNLRRFADWCRQRGCVLPESLGYNEFARWDQLRGAEGHIDFGAHTLWRPRLSQLSESSARNEICESIELIARRLGTKPSAFSYPIGKLRYLRPSIVAAVRSTEIRHAFTNVAGFADPSQDLLLLPRICGGNGVFWRNCPFLVFEIADAKSNSASMVERSERRWHPHSANRRKPDRRSLEVGKWVSQLKQTQDKTYATRTTTGN